MSNENEMRDPSGRPMGTDDREDTVAGRGDPAMGRGHEDVEGRREGRTTEPGMTEREMTEPGRPHGTAAEEGATYGQPSTATSERSGDHGIRFEELNARFIDDPRDAVRRAESMVEKAVDQMMADIHQRVDAIRREIGDNADTERLRLAMRRYRDLLDQIVMR